MHKSISRWHSLLHAIHGIGYLIKTQRNTWIYLPITGLVIYLGFFFHIQSFEWIALVFSLGLVWSFECLNTAIETSVDLTSPEIHPLAKISKDCAAGGVLLTAITAGIVGLLVFLPKFIDLISGG